MSDVADPFELLGRMNPLPDHLLLPPTRAYVPAQRTLQRILADARRAAPPALTTGSGGDGRGDHRTWRLAVLAATTAVVVTLAAAAAWIITRPAANPATISCFASASLQADAVGASIGRSDDPVARCAEEWRSGAFVGWGQAPPLAACVLRSGVIGVFPGEPAVCDRLGLPRLATQSGGDDARVTQLIDDLTMALTAPACVDVSSASDLVRQRLEQLGLEGWTLVAPATTVPGRPCSSVAFDPPAKTVTLVPVPVPPGS